MVSFFIILAIKTNFDQSSRSDMYETCFDLRNDQRESL